jgi:hypothetical protein
VDAFLHNAVLILLVALGGAMMMAIFAWTTMGAREAWRSFLIFVVAFSVMGLLAVAPTILTGEWYGLVNLECTRALVGGGSC